MPQDLEPSEINQLVSLFNAQRYGELESVTRSLVEQLPDSGFAWKALGTCLKIQGKGGLFALQKAAVLLPTDAEAHSNLGGILNDLGHLKEALASQRRALEIRPSFPEAYNNLANTLQGLGRLDDAVATYRRALDIKPDYAEAHGNLGIALRDLGRLNDAVSSCRRALKLNPDYAEGHSHLGSTLKDLGQLDEAVASYRRSLEFKPDYVEGHSNLGIALRDLGRLNDAVSSCRRALRVNPDYAEGHNHLGNALKDLGWLNVAVATYRRTLEIKPDYSEGLSNLGNALKDLGRLNDAVAIYRRALEVKPDYLDAHSNLLFTHNYLLDQPAEALLSEARRFGDIAARQAHSYVDWHNDPDPDRCLRVGWVSGDLHNHPVGYFAEGVIAALASDAGDRLELFGYPTHFQADELTERIKACCHGWHSAAGLSDECLAKRIRDDRIDILIDLSGHTAHNRLRMFARKPAPVQVSWLGYFATTGVAAMDYFLADPWTLPKSDEAHFTEKIWRLPETRLCFTPPDVDVQIASLPALKNGYITFGCFSNLTKINDDVVALWGRVLATVPNSRLFVKAKQLREGAVRQDLVRRFAAQGVAAERLSLEGLTPRAEYLAVHRRVDVTLDPFPFPGGTTSVESLWMGVPVLTLTGQRFLSRQGTGLLMNAGLREWIATDKDDYVARAAFHTTDLPRLARLRSGLRQQLLASPLFDAPGFARHFEAALRGMWTEWCNTHSTQPP